MESSELEGRLGATAVEVVEAGRRLHRTVSTAESCTAGMVSAAVASVPGASEVLQGGAATYTEAIKQRVLGVSAKTLEEHTAVSHETACEMAQGSRELFQSDVAVSVTGYAGPGGGTEDDPVGTVYIGVASARGVWSERHVFPGTRQEVRLAAALRALELARDELV